MPSNLDKSSKSDLEKRVTFIRRSPTGLFHSMIMSSANTAAEKYMIEVGSYFRK